MSSDEFLEAIEAQRGTIDYFAGCVHFPGGVTVHADQNIDSNTEQLRRIMDEYRALSTMKNQ